MALRRKFGSVLRTVYHHRLNSALTHERFASYSSKKPCTISLGPLIFSDIVCTNTVALYDCSVLLAVQHFDLFSARLLHSQSIVRLTPCFILWRDWAMGWAVAYLTTTLWSSRHHQTLYCTVDVLLLLVQASSQPPCSDYCLGSSFTRHGVNGCIT